MATPLLVAGCAALRHPSPEAVAGCYQFRWDAGARALALPWGVELLEEELEEGWLVTAHFADVRRALTATSPSGREDHPFGYWRWTAADSVEVGHPGGGGFTLTLSLDGKDLVGRGRATGDALVPEEAPGVRPGQPVVAYRVLCGAS